MRAGHRTALLGRLFWTLFVSIFPILHFWGLISYTAEYLYTSQNFSLVGGTLIHVGGYKSDCAVKYKYVVSGIEFAGFRDGGNLGGTALDHSVCRRDIPKGASIGVLYNPANPSDSLVASEYPKGVFTLSLIVISFWCLVIYALWKP
ncbi:DUF3592 domain-containing protein [Deinococcus sp. HMF7620]|uniref:DUF3592 domain-containing protein n=1 Tax=Deinococcus arboris TaxID=2682977 RepID=A0A7C9M9S9_9DEIO|nr:DUF3592 domain-containing protein [Deinococcus arboris]